MSPPENLFALRKFLINSSVGIGLKDVFLHSSHLYCNLLFLSSVSLDTDLSFFLSFQVMQSNFEIPDKLST